AGTGLDVEVGLLAQPGEPFGTERIGQEDAVAHRALSAPPGADSPARAPREAPESALNRADGTRSRLHLDLVEFDFTGAQACGPLVVRTPPWSVPRERQSCEGDEK